MSSDKAYGEYAQKDLPYKESYDLRPLYPYDVSKAAADMIAKSYAFGIYKLPVITTRFANVYGPGQLNFTALIPDCILANLKYRDFITRGNGNNIRDFIFIEYITDLYLCIAYNLSKDKNLRGEVFNAGTGNGYLVKDIISKICTIKLIIQNYIQPSVKNLKNNKLIGEIQDQFMSYNKLMRYFKWKPMYNLNQGLEISYNWYKGFLNENNYNEFIK